MMKTAMFSALVASTCLLAGCSSRPVTVPDAPVEASGYAMLHEWMSGRFSSAGQALRDPDYYDISLVMQPIWADRSDALWLYVEQAVAVRPDRPYRQRVYELIEHADGRLESRVYALPGDPLEHAGAWKLDRPLAGLTPGDLDLREGCSVWLTRRADGTFAGSTEGDLCGSNLNGAAYATSEVIIRPDAVLSWDRGYDADGEQVWGAVKGPYIFDRLTD
jgi:CpeT protein